MGEVYAGGHAVSPLKIWFHDIVPRAFVNVYETRVAGRREASMRGGHARDTAELGGLEVLAVGVLLLLILAALLP